MFGTLRRAFVARVNSWRRTVSLGLVLVLGTAVLQGCSGIRPEAASGPEAYKVIPAVGVNRTTPLDYKIGALDVLSITVFQERDLSLTDVPVDASGNITLPLIGQLQVAGSTSAQIAAMIADRLGQRFLVNPQVSVLIKTSVSQKVTVDGQVTEPGVYELQGQTTLVQSIAMAKGTTRIAKLDEVIVFRQVDDTRYAARFNIEDIRKGRQPDPQILGNDVVVVGLSQSKSAFRDFLGIAPALTGAFVAIGQLASN